MRAFSAAISIVIAFTCSAQIPNGGFENWYSNVNYMEPEDWWTLNSLTWQLSSTLSAEEGTPGPVGGSFIKVTSRPVNGIVEVGRITCGNEFTGAPGFPFTQRPSIFNGWHQYHPQGSDQGNIYMTLTRWDPVQMERIVVGHAVYNVLAAITNWQPFVQEFIYYTDDTPDSARVYVIASMNEPVAGSSIWVDDLQAEGSVVGLTEHAEGMDLHLFPSPANDRLQISSDAQLLSIMIMGLHGSVLRTRSLSGTSATIDVAALAPGLYFAVIESDAGTVMRRFGKE